MVCLIRPPTLTSAGAVAADAILPLGLAYVAGALKKAGVETHCIDCVGEGIHQYTRWRADPFFPRSNVLMHGLTHEETVARIPFSASIIGVSAMFSVEWVCTRELIEQIRSRFAGATIVLGGEHATACASHILKSCPSVDVCALGEGEETMVELAQAVCRNEEWQHLKGIAFRKGDTIAVNPRRERLARLDEIARPNWELFPVEDYISGGFHHSSDRGRTMPIMASRGCPYRCTFCSSPQMWGTRWSVRSPSDVIDEMQLYQRHHRVSNFDFEDLTAIVRKDWILEFCRLVEKEAPNITWQLPTGTRSEALDEEVCRALYRSGCRSITYAPESGSQAELARIKKKVSLKRMLRSIRSAKREGMEVKVNLIIGFPETTWADVARTFLFITRLAFQGVDAISAFAFSPYPGSEIFEELEARGQVKLDDDYFLSLLSYADTRLARLSLNPKLSVTSLSVISSSAMAYFFGLSFFLRPARIVQTLIAYGKHDRSSRLLFALSHRIRKGKVIHLMERARVDTVVLEGIARRL